MTEPPRPKRFQIHLSTAIVMMFVAGALIWANVAKQTFYNIRPVTTRTEYGWPFVFWKHVEGTASGFSYFIGPEGIQLDLPPDYFYWNALTDFLLFATVLLAACFLCESLIRRQT